MPWQTEPFRFSPPASPSSSQTSSEPFTPLPVQREPEGDWTTWVMLAGRGAGKTEGACRFVDREARKAPIRIAIIAPTLGDAVESCVNGPSGLKAVNPTVRLVGGAGGLHVYWPNGSEAKLFGAYTPDDVERLRAGGNRDLAWFEEYCAWRYVTEATDQANFGLRLGEHPRKIVSTTPKPIRQLKELLALPTTVVTTGTTNENTYLSEARRKELYDRYAGTSLGRQELGGEIIGQVEGALWERQRLEELRVTEAQLPALKRVVIAIDPSASSNEQSDEAGIVACGLGVDNHGYVLADLSLRASPHRWAQAAIAGYEKLHADRIVAERNNGGDMVEETLRTVNPYVPYKGVWASRGKRTRAEPVAALYEQGRIHHVGPFQALEDELCTFVPDVDMQSPNRLDALVWAFHELFFLATDETVYQFRTVRSER